MRGFTDRILLCKDRIVDYVNIREYSSVNTVPHILCSESGSTFLKQLSVAINFELNHCFLTKQFFNEYTNVHYFVMNTQM